MKREFLESFNLDSNIIDKIMSENGKDINATKAKYADYDELKSQLENANKTIEKFADYEQTKADVEKYKTEAERIQKETNEKLAKMEVQAKIKDFTASKKFVNDLTKEAINTKLETLLNQTESKGKSLEDLFSEITQGKENILIAENEPTPPVPPTMGSSGKGENGVLSAFKALNPNLKL